MDSSRIRGITWGQFAGNDYKGCAGEMQRARPNFATGRFMDAEDLSKNHFPALDTVILSGAKDLSPRPIMPGH